MTKKTPEAPSGRDSDNGARSSRRQLVALVPGHLVLKHPKAVAVELARRCVEAIAQSRDERVGASDDGAASVGGGTASALTVVTDLPPNQERVDD